MMSDQDKYETVRQLSFQRYPVRDPGNWRTVDFNATNRAAFVEGYKAATQDRTIDSVPSCGQENDHRKAVTEQMFDLTERLRNPAWCHSCGHYDSPQLAKEETVKDMAEAADEIERLRAEVDTLKTALTAPSKEEIALRTELKAAEYAAKTNWEGWQQEIERTQSQIDQANAHFKKMEAQLAQEIERVKMAETDLATSLTKLVNARTALETIAGFWSGGNCQHARDIARAALDEGLPTADDIPPGAEHPANYRKAFVKTDD